MSKKYYRFFGGLLTAQEHWLNKMSEKGYRLIRAEKMLYEFEECKPDQVKYCVEFIGQKSKVDASDYHEFLEGMGYKVFYKNINLNYSVGKVRLRHRFTSRRGVPLLGQQGWLLAVGNPGEESPEKGRRPQCCGCQRKYNSYGCRLLRTGRPRKTHLGERQMCLRTGTH